MMWYRLGTALFWIFTAAAAAAGLSHPVLGQEVQTQSAAVTGNVYGGDTRDALHGATVAVKRDGTIIRGTTTDSQGRYELENLEPGSAIVEVRFVGYRSYERPLELMAGERHTISVTLESEAVTLAALEIIGDSPHVHRKLAGTATRLSARDVELINPIGTQDLLGYVPGIHGFADDGIGNSRISIGIRGLNPRRSSRVLILEDGIPIQPALYVYPNMYYNPPVERIDRVEVIKGSGAIKFGPQTMGGVVNYITSRPRRSIGYSGQATTGTNGYLSLFTEMGGWGSEKVEPEVQLLFKRGDGFRQNNDFIQYNGTFKLSIMPDAERVYYVKGNVDYEHSNATYTGLTEYSFRNNAEFNPKENDDFDVFRSSLDLISTRRRSSRLTATTLGYLSYFNRNWWRELDVFVRPSALAGDPPTQFEPLPWYTGGDLVRVGGGDENFGNLRSFYTGGLQHSYNLDHILVGSSARLEAGARIHWERFIDDTKVGDAPDARDGVYFTGDPDDPESITIVGKSHHYETTALSVYAEEQLDFGRLTVVPGVRFEIFEQERIDRLNGSTYLDKTSSVLLPGFGFNYALGSLNAFGGVHRGYTPPSSGALSIVNFGEGAGEGGLDLRSEKSWNSELGLRGAFDWLTFEAAAFHLAIEDIVAAGRGTAFTNLGRTRNYGVEWSSTLRASAAAGFLPDVNVVYTFLQTEILEGRVRSARSAGVEVDISGNQLPYAPEHTVTAGIEKAFGFGLAFRADVRFVDRVYTDFENIETTSNRGDTGPVPSNTVIDASARYAASRHLHVVLTAKNLLDDVYIGSRLHSNPGQPEAHLSSGIMPGTRRQINLALRYRY
jgi:Fe(3+) dicitrate transport protein